MLRRLVPILFGVLGALAASQAPGFTQQYVQNLEGRVDTLRAIVSRFDRDIAAIGYDRAAALSECAVAERLLAALCDGITEDIARYERLSAHRAVLLSAEPWARPVILARAPDRVVARSAYDRFEPAVPTTATGVGYAAAGFAGAWALVRVLSGVLAFPFSKRPRTAPAR